MAIEESVGVLGTNLPEDVARIQRLLNATQDGLRLPVDGVWSSDLGEAWRAVTGESLDRMTAGDELLIALVDAVVRSFSQLPVPTVGGGYYAYESRVRQWGTSSCIQTVLAAARDFGAVTGIRCGIGDISLEDGAPMPPHVSHRDGTDVDVRPIRRDGTDNPVRYQDDVYDGIRTDQLVTAFLAQANVSNILFNDPVIIARHAPRVKPYADHDNHLHVNMRG